MKPPFPSSEEIESWPVFWRTAPRVPGSEAYVRANANVWEWGDPSDGYTAILHGDNISWNWHGPKDFGNTIEQDVPSFVAFGPDEKTTPPGLPFEMLLQIRARDFARWPKLLEEARKRERAQTPPEARHSTDEAARRRAEVLEIEEQPAPLFPLLLLGFAVIAGSVALAAALAVYAPLAAKYASLFIPVLIGFAAAFRFGSISLIVAGFFGLAAGLTSQVALERYFELSRGPLATLASIAEAPRNANATRFSVTDVRAVPGLAGKIERRVSLRSGAGPSPQITHLHVAPLVPSHWKRGDPVPAWLACKTSPGFDCLQLDADKARRLIRVREADLVDFSEAVRNAERRHGLTSANSAPIIETAYTAFGAPVRYLEAAALLPLAAFGLWAAGITAVRVWPQRDRSPRQYKRAYDWIWKAVLAGLAGSIAPNALFYLKAKLGILPTFVPYAELQKTLAALTGADVHPALPWLLSFLNGALVLGPLFRTTYTLLPGESGLVKGIYFGIAGWLLVGFVFLPLIGLGLFAINAGLGVWPSLLMLAMLLIYGAVTGAIYGRLR